jgi:AMIN domain
MRGSVKSALLSLPLACALWAAAQAPATIRSVSVLGAGSNPEVEILGTAPLSPTALVITGPDRLVIDFPNAVPGAHLRTIEVNRGELKAVRVGRFSDQPPVTRVVLDLKGPQPYQLFPSGKSVIVKLHSAANPPTAAAMAPAPAAPVVVEKPAPKVEVDFKNGELKIWANRATLAEVLNEVHRRTGAELSMPPGAGQDPIVANLGPAPARDVLASLLNGSKFNFVMVSSDRDPSQLRGIFLTLRGSGPDTSISYPAVTASTASTDSGMQAVQQYEPPPDQAPMQPETAAPTDNSAPAPPDENPPPQ